MTDKVRIFGVTVCTGYDFSHFDYFISLVQFAMDCSMRVDSAFIKECDTL
jgi:hypothetical protein